MITRWERASLIGMLILATIIMVALMGCDYVRTVPAISVTCQEDMPCWDCNTMGNRVCGPTTTKGSK